VLCLGGVFAVVDAAQLIDAEPGNQKQRQGFEQAWKESASTFTPPAPRGS